MSLLEYLFTRTRLWWAGFAMLCAGSYLAGLIIGVYYLVITESESEIANIIMSLPDTLRLLWLVAEPYLP